MFEAMAATASEVTVRAKTELKRLWVMVLEKRTGDDCQETIARRRLPRDDVWREWRVESGDTAVRLTRKILNFQEKNLRINSDGQAPYNP